MTTVRALLREYAEQGYEPAALLQALNRAAVRDLEAGQFMTLFYAVVDTAERALTWASAGHAPALVYRHAQDDVVELGAQDIPLGVERDWRYAQQRIDGWQSGDVALLGTDGIWETRNGAGALFGRERLKELLRARRGAEAAAIAQALFGELQAFRGPRPLTDDVTVVIARAC
jgi:sigma-B regulation protein RsbU (phosphoserine phosphatase)